MANSSDWIDTVSHSSARLPDWMAAAPETRGFDARLPFLPGAEGQAELGEVRQSQSSTESAHDPQATALDRAFAKGLEEGRAAATVEYSAELERQRALRLVFRQLDQTAMDSLASELATTVETLCTQAFGEFELPHDVLSRQCEAAAKRLGSAASDCHVQLHADDLAMLDEDTRSAWRVEANSTLERGTVLLIGPAGEVRDGPEEWRRAIAAALRG